MEREHIEYFTELLEGQLNELLNKADTAIVELLSSEETSADPLDRASNDTDRTLSLRIRDRESKLIRKIKRALRSIEEGTFGICEECGEEIAINRLKARPVTTLCIDCKTRMEAFEKAGSF